jgi:hypothetical protein
MKDINTLTGLSQAYMLPQIARNSVNLSVKSRSVFLKSHHSHN